MTHFYLIPLFAAWVNGALALFVFTREPRLRANQVFFAWGCSIALWNLGAFFLFRVGSADEALVWARITQFAVVWLPVICFHLALILTRRRMPRLLAAGYIASALFAGADLTPLFVKGVRRVPYGWFSVAGPGYWAFCNLLFPVLVFASLALFIRKARTCSRHEKRKFVILAATTTMLAVLGTHDLLPVLGIDRYPWVHWTIYPWGTLSASLYGVTMGYGVLHDQLLDMRIALGRHAAMLLRLVFLIAFAYILLTLASLVGPGTFSNGSFVTSLVVLAISAGVTSYFFPKLLGGGSERLERRILGDRFEYQDQVRAFVESVGAYSDAAVLLNETAKLLTTAMRLSFAEFVVLDARTQEVQHVCRQPAVADDWAAGLGPDSPIFEHFRAAAAPHLDCRDPDAPLWANAAEREARRSLQGRGPELAFRLGSREQPYGAMLVGRKAGEEPITSLDLELLTAVSVQLGFALDRIRLSEHAALTEKHEVLGELSRGLAHDLNGLITPISVYLQLQSGNQGDDADQLALYRMALRAINTIKTYVQEAVFFATTFKLNLMPVTVSAILTAIGEVAEARASERGVALQFEASSGEFRFHGDRILLQRMLCNLVFNAIDASESGKTVRVRGIALVGQRRRSDTVRFLVIDEGCGIPPENLERVFDPYFSTKDTGDKVRGFGLGLTVAQRIVHLHHGTISVKSTVGVGTTLQVDLPPDPAAVGPAPKMAVA